MKFIFGQCRQCGETRRLYNADICHSCMRKNTKAAKFLRLVKAGHSDVDADCPINLTETVSTGRNINDKK